MMIILSNSLNVFYCQMDKVYNVGFISSLAAGGRSAIFYSAGGSLLLHLIYRCGVLIASGKEEYYRYFMIAIS